MPCRPGPPGRVPAAGGRPRDARPAGHPFCLFVGEAFGRRCRRSCIDPRNRRSMHTRRGSDAGTASPVTTRRGRVGPPKPTPGESGRAGLRGRPDPSPTLEPDPGHAGGGRWDSTPTA
jgi:hypothetical protein